MLAAVNVAIITSKNNESRLTLSSLLNIAVANGESSYSTCTSSEFLGYDIMEPCSDGYGYYTYREVNVNCNSNGYGTCADGIYISWEDCDGDKGGCNPRQIICR